MKHLPNSCPGRRTITKSLASQVNSKKYAVCTGGEKNRVAPQKRRLILKVNAEVLHAESSSRSKNILKTIEFYKEDLAFVHHAGFGGFSQSAAPELLRILKAGGVGTGTLVDLGCGSGLWARVAQNAGFSVIGIDRSPAMVRLARKISSKSHFH